ncbi:MAG: TetR/AcrR family transcriptional regulator [Eubacteriaceae bacterium]
MNKAEIRTRNKIDKILTTIIKLFSENDIKKVTMDDIARQANVSKMTLYKYFGDRESLYKYVFKWVVKQHDSQLEKVFSSKDNTTQNMIAFLNVSVDFIDKMHYALCMKLSQFDDDIKKEFTSLNHKNKTIMIDLIMQGKKNMLISRDISNECIYHYIDMGLCYYINNTDYRKKILSDNTFRKEFMTFLLSHVFVNFSHFDL